MIENQTAMEPPTTKQPLTQAAPIETSPSPPAYLHNPDFSFAGFAANGSFQGNTFVWALSKPHVQVADPGWFSLDVAGATTGTAISSGRPFRLNGGSFPVYLEEVAIIQ